MTLFVNFNKVNRKQTQWRLNLQKSLTDGQNSERQTMPTKFYVCVRCLCWYLKNHQFVGWVKKVKIKEMIIKLNKKLFKKTEIIKNKKVGKAVWKAIRTKLRLTRLLPPLKTHTHTHIQIVSSESPGRYK